MVNAITNDNYQQLVGSAPGLHVLRFWASWCGPCRVMHPIFNETASELESVASFWEVDVDAATEVANKFGISSIPTVVIVRDGLPVERLVGVSPKAVLSSRVLQSVA